MIKLVIFDLDGTLYDYDIANENAEKELFIQIKEKFDVDEKHSKLLLNKAKKIVKSHLGNVAASHNRMLYMQNICEQIKVNPCKHALELYDIYWNSFFDYMRLYDYVLPLFDELKRINIKIGILTDLTAHIQFLKIRRLNIEKYLDYVVTSEEVGEEKPSEKMFMGILSKAKLKPDQAIMIGDDDQRDIYGAENTGIYGIKYIKQNDFKEKILDLILNDQKG